MNTLDVLRVVILLSSTILVATGAFAQIASPSNAPSTTPKLTAKPELSAKVAGNKPVLDTNADLLGTWVAIGQESSLELKVKFVATPKGDATCAFAIAGKDKEEPCEIRRRGNSLALSANVGAQYGSSADKHTFLGQLRGEVMNGKIFPEKTSVKLYRIGSAEEAQALKDFERWMKSPLRMLEKAKFVSTSSSPSAPVPSPGNSCVGSNSGTRTLVFGPLVEADVIAADLSIVDSATVTCNETGAKGTRSTQNTSKNAVTFALIRGEEGTFWQLVQTHQCPLCAAGAQNIQGKIFDGTFVLNDPNTLTINYSENNVERIYRRQ